MATIKDQVSLRAGIASWLNRSDLTDENLDQFIEIGESRIYETLRVPPLEISQGFSVTTSNSSIIVPNGFLEMIELKLDGGASKDDDIVLGRVDSKVFNNHRTSHVYTRHIGNFLLTDKEAKQSAGGTYIMYYYKAGDSIGTYSTTTTAVTAFVVGNYYKIVSLGNTSQSNWNTVAGTSNITYAVGAIFKAAATTTGTGTAYEESIPYILSDVSEIILYAACEAGSVFLGDLEMEQKFNGLTERKIVSLNQEEIRASMKGAAFSSRFSSLSL